MAKKNNAVDVEVIRVTPYKAKKGEKSSLLGFAVVSVNGIGITGIRIMAGKNGQPFVSMPAERGANGEWYNTIYMNLGDKDTNVQAYSEISSAVLEVYEEL